VSAFSFIMHATLTTFGRRERDWVLSEFKAGRSPILIATDVASRGLGTYMFLHRKCFEAGAPWGEYLLSNNLTTEWKIKHPLGQLAWVVLKSCAIS